MADMIPENDFFSSLLKNFIGSQSKVAGQESLDVDNKIDTDITGSQTDKTTNNNLVVTKDNTSQQQNTTGTISNLQQLLSQLTGNTTNQSSNTQKTVADVSKLTEVFNRQAAGVTPEMLSAIFTEGSKAVPQLAVNHANALGARSSGNSPLAGALTDLNSSLVSQAAQLNTKLLGDAGNTAAQIAELTKSIQTDGTSNQQQTQTQNQNTSGTQTQDTTTNTTGTSTQQQMTQQIIDKLMNLQQSQSQNQQQNSTKNNSSLRQDTINKDTSSDLAMAALMASLFKGGAGNIGANIGGAIKTVTDLISGIGGAFSGGSGVDTTPNGSWWADSGNDPISIPSDGGGWWDSITDGIGGAWDTFTGWLGFADGGPVPNSREEFFQRAHMLMQERQRRFADGGIVDPTDEDKDAKKKILLEAPKLEIGKTPAHTSPLGLAPMGGSGSFSGGTSGRNRAAGVPMLGEGGADATSGFESQDTFGTIGGFLSSPVTQAIATLGLGPLGAMASKGINAFNAFNPSQNTIQAALSSIHGVNNPGFSTGQFGGDPMGGFGPGGSNAEALGLGIGGLGFGLGIGQDAIGLGFSDTFGGFGGAGSVGGGGDGGDGAAAASGDGTGSGANGNGNGDGGMGTGSSGEGEAGDGNDWADGGKLPPVAKDPKGIKDTIPAKVGGTDIKLSGGEYIVPKDVVDYLGTDFFDSLKMMLHTPAEMQ